MEPKDRTTGVIAIISYDFSENVKYRKIVVRSSTTRGIVGHTSEGKVWISVQRSILPRLKYRIEKKSRVTLVLT